MKLLWQWRRLALSITGVAGPDPDEDGNPVGLVCIAVACQKGEARHITKDYGGIGREDVCNRAMKDALELLMRVTRSG